MRYWMRHAGKTAGIAAASAVCGAAWEHGLPYLANSPHLTTVLQGTTEEIAVAGAICAVCYSISRIPDVRQQERTARSWRTHVAQQSSSTPTSSAYASPLSRAARSVSSTIGSLFE